MRPVCLAAPVGAPGIEVAGHDDTSGHPQYKQGLSMRRAQAVAANWSATV